MDGEVKLTLSRLSTVLAYLLDSLLSITASLRGCSILFGLTDSARGVYTRFLGLHTINGDSDAEFSSSESKHGSGVCSILCGLSDAGRGMNNGFCVLHTINDDSDAESSLSESEHGSNEPVLTTGLYCKLCNVSGLTHMVLVTSSASSSGGSARLPPLESSGIPEPSVTWS